MITMSDGQMDKFLELVETHYGCFEKHYPEYQITYENVLELNHKKILDITEDLEDGEEEIIDYVLDQLLKEYRLILKREGTE
jgi:hypothetical protein